MTEATAKERPATDISVYDQAKRDISGIEGFLGLLELGLYSDENLSDIPGLAWLIVDAQEKAERMHAALEHFRKAEKEPFENPTESEILELAKFLKANGYSRDDALHLIQGDVDYFREKASKQ